MCLLDSYTLELNRDFPNWNLFFLFSTFIEEIWIGPHVIFLPLMTWHYSWNKKYSKQPKCEGEERDFSFGPHLTNTYFEGLSSSHIHIYNFPYTVGNWGEKRAWHLPAQWYVCRGIQQPLPVKVKIWGYCHDHDPSIPHSVHSLNFNKGLLLTSLVMNQKGQDSESSIRYTCSCLAAFWKAVDSMSGEWCLFILLQFSGLDELCWLLQCGKVVFSLKLSPFYLWGLLNCGLR